MQSMKSADYEHAMVLTADGKKLGTVKEISGSYFKVDARLHKDYWLSSELIRSRDDDAIILDLAGKEVAEHRLSEPGLEPEEDPFRKIATKPVIDEEDLAQQRDRMERELAEQSRRMIQRN